MVCSSGNSSSWIMTWLHLHPGESTNFYSNERQHVASGLSLQVMRDGVARLSRFGIPSPGDIFWYSFIFCMRLGNFAPQAGGGSIFVVQSKVLEEQCALLVDVFGHTPCVAFGIPKGGIPLNGDCDKLFNELRW
eukprot:CAMPEP_0114658490 /NCGR_PEP_ID=MMETSP0191-20121206/15868_1 /TAXON_ID=126664 /ORGANISM="Sorites sp." /LENGTH=133 /DNA_ID=CAMNT_0001880701 /DNA_START=66 /DNA_END=464 /DNA_ORIENTATION=+